MAIDEETQLVLIGAGHSHLHLLKNIQELAKRNFKIILISPSQFYYNGVVPGEIGGIYPHKLGLIRVQCHLEPVNGVFIQDRVLEIDIQEKKVLLEKSPPLSYDIVSFNTGAQGNLPPNPSQIKMFPTRPVDYLWQFMKELTVSAKISPNGLKIVVIGGGAAGVELACN
ncbi:MAG: FAD-dependent oxidoreductase, partial [Candidatus Thorarchaeota archaeon]